MKFTIWDVAMVGSFLVMFTAKVTQVGIGAHFPWWLVFMPIYVPLGFGVILFGVFMTYYYFKR